MLNALMSAEKISTVTIVVERLFNSMKNFTQWTQLSDNIESKEVNSKALLE